MSYFHTLIGHKAQGLKTTLEQVYTHDK